MWNLFRCDVLLTMNILITYFNHHFFKSLITFGRGRLRKIKNAKLTNMTQRIEQEMVRRTLP